MSVTGRVQVLEEVSLSQPDGWKICFQWCRYLYSDNSMEHGYRFIWRRPDGSLQGARGQARLPSFRVIQKLQDMARDAQWGHHIGESDDQL